MNNVKILPTLILGSLVSSYALGTQVINDNLVVKGSECIGLDCVSSPAFGFDTLRLKENNLRIKFDDTSTSASFPKNDWQLTANDSANGGANKFSIDDITGNRTPFTIEAGAPNHSLYVDDGGRLGLGTSTPVVDVHVKSGNTPTLRLEQDGSSGFAPQTFDVAGNEANFFIRDATNGSTLPFRIRPGAPTSAIDIAASGDVGIGTSSPKAPVHLITSGSAFTPNALTDVLIQDNGTTGDALVTVIGEAETGSAQLNMGDSDNEFMGRVVYYNSLDVMAIAAGGVDSLMILSDGRIRLGTYDDTTTHVLEHSNGAHLTTGGVWTDVSSREAKENIENLSYEDSLDAVMGLNPVTYNYKLEQDEDYAGFIAEDVPSLVATNGRKNLTSMDIVAVLTKVVQQQQQTIDDLSVKVAGLETR